MATIFATSPGQAVALQAGDNDAGLPIALDGSGGSFYPNYKSVLTEVGIALDGSYQFTHTLKEVIYVYVFGNRISQFRMSGISFADYCPGGGGPSGIELMLGFYRENNIAARQRPMQIQIGTTAAGRFRGYMTHFKADILKPEASLAQWSLNFHVFPGT